MSDQHFDIADTLSVAQAAKLLGCSGQTVRERIKRGELQGYDVRTSRGKEWRVLRAGPLADARYNIAAESQAAEGHNTLSVIGGTSASGPSSEVPDQEVDQIRKLPATLPQPGVVEALGLLRDSLAREAQLAAENARLREQLAAVGGDRNPSRPLQLEAPALGFWLALWARLAGSFERGRAG